MIADDQTRVKIYRMLSLKSFVSERDDFLIGWLIFTLVDFEPMERFENRRDEETCFFCGGTSCRVQ